MLRAPQSRDSIIELSLITQQATCREQHLIPASVYFRTQEVRGPNEISNHLLWWRWDLDSMGSHGPMAYTATTATAILSSLQIPNARA